MVILDDLISTLHPEVGANFFEKSVLELLQGKTRNVVTNSLDILKECDRIVVITGGDCVPGRIVEEGTFVDLMANRSAFSALMARHRGEEQGAEKESEEDNEQKKQLRKAKAVKAQGGSIIRAEERAKGGVECEQRCTLVISELEVDSVCLLLFTFFFDFIARCVLDEHILGDFMVERSECGWIVQI